MKKWYAVYTRFGCEKKVADAIGKKGWHVYLPVSLLKKKVVEPVFPNLVFVNIPESKHKHLKLVPGVLNLFYWLQKPAVITDVEIETMRHFLNEHAIIQIQQTSVSESEMVRLSSGSPIEDLIDRRSRNDKLTLPSLGYDLIAQDELIEGGATKQVLSML